MGKSLILQIIQDLQVLKDTFPSMKLVWTTMTLWRAWGADCKPGRIDRAQRDVNREVCRAMRAWLGSVISHPEIVSCWPQLYRSDGIHLSKLDLGLFLKDLEGGLRAEIFSLGGGLGAYK